MSVRLKGGTMSIIVPGVIPAYTKDGATALAEDWLVSENGNGIIPANGKVYVIMSSGDYQYKMYVFDTSDNKYHSIANGSSGSSGGGSSPGGEDQFFTDQEIEDIWNSV